MIEEITKEIVCCIKFCFRPARKPNLMGVYSFVYLNEDKMAVYDAESMTTQGSLSTILRKKNLTSTKMSEDDSSGAEAAEEEGGSSSPDEEAIDEEAMEEDEFIKEILVRNTEHIDRDPNCYEPEESDGPGDDEPEPNKSNEKSNEGKDGEDGDEADDEDEDETPDDSAKS